MMETANQVDRLTYPDRLIARIREQWQKKDRLPAQDLPPDAHLQTLLDLAFHASLHSEEGRPLTFRLAYCRPEDLHQGESPLRRDAPLPFALPRPLSVLEIVRLAPAADPHQLLMGVELGEDDQLRIWGLIDSGLRWWEYERGERYRFMSALPPDCLTVSSFHGGSLTISRGGIPLVQLRRGRLVPPASINFSGDAFGDFLRDASRALYEEAAARLAADGEGEIHLDLEFVRNILLAFLQRILWRVQSARHGGTIVILPDCWPLGSPACEEQIRVKYLLQDPGTWHLLVDYFYHNARYGYYEGRLVPGRTSAEMRERRRHHDDAADLMRDRLSLIASLAAVDGAVILDRRLRVLGFGAEILARSPELVEAITPNSDSPRAPIENFGTRHRSALRLCYQHEQVIAFVISQDGDISIALRVDDGVLLRPAENLINTLGIFV